MFKEDGNGETQYCPMCKEWAERYELLENKLKKIKEICEYQDLYRGRQALATKILKVCSMIIKDKEE